MAILHLFEEMVKSFAEFIYNGGKMRLITNHFLSDNDFNNLIDNTEVNNEDLIIAAEVQAELIPSVFPINQQYEFSGKYIPFDIIGGDYYDLITIDEDNITFCICDVAGKGVSAGMLMSNFQGRAS